MIPDVPQDHNPQLAPVIKLIGVGGGGCNAVEQMIAADIHGVDFTCVNTDAQALAKYNPEYVIQLGTQATRGLGAGTDPEIGRMAAEEDRDRIAASIANTDMLFLTAGMGGGTGTGAIPVIARVARELGVLTVAVVTKPFSFEGGKRRKVAEAGIAELREQVDSLIVVPNENLLTHLGPNISLMDAFAASNDVLTNAVQSIAELITNPGLINVDFADVKSVMTEMGEAMMSTGRGIGDYRARDAAIAATESPLLDEIDLKEARGILANITASSDLSMGEFQIVGEILDQITADDANVVIGTVFDQKMMDEIRVTVVATGLKSSKSARNSARGGPQKQKASKLKTRKKPGLFSAWTSKKDKNKDKATEQDPTTRTTRPENIDTATPAAVAQQQDIYHNEPANDPVESYELPAEPVVETCRVCGNSVDAHTVNCPRGKKPAAFEMQGAHVIRDSANATDDQYDVDHLRTANVATDNNEAPRQPEEITRHHQPERRPEPVRNEFKTGKKKSNQNKYIAGLVAGTAVLVSVFYLIIADRVTVGDNELVQSGQDQTSIAQRKLKAANRRLTGIDE